MTNSTTFTDDQTTIMAAWLNDVNSVVYNLIAAGGAVPTTGSQALLNLGLLALLCPQSATFAALPAEPLGFYLVLADETKGNAPIIYFFTAAHRYWIAMTQDA